MAQALLFARLAVVWVLAVRLAKAQTSTCYFPNGTSSPDFIPCNDGAEHSACCTPTDECLTNGLCRPADADSLSNSFWRDLCTDPTWESDACPKYCFNTTTNPGAPNVAYFAPGCSEETYCCGDPQIWADDGNYYCCDDESMLFTAGAPEWLSGPHLVIDAFKATSGSAASQSVSSTQSSSASGSTGTIDAASATGTGDGSSVAQTSANNDNNTAIGVGVGVAVGAALLIAAAIGFFVWRRRGGRQNEKSQKSDVRPEYGQAGWQKAHMSPYPQSAPPYSDHQTRGPLQPSYYSELSGEEGNKVEMAGMKEDRDPTELSAERAYR